MTGAVLSPREALWLGCREKTCCSTYSVMPTGADLWRISRALELAVWDFTRFADASADDPGAFALDADGPRFQVVLAKRDGGSDRPPTCVFLWRVADGHAQCALGAIRPTACHAHPAVLDHGVVCVGDHDGCTCGAWTQVSLDADRERPTLLRLERERNEHAEMVSEWNARVADDPTGRDYPEFCDFLMNRCAALYGAAAD